MEDPFIRLDKKWEKEKEKKVEQKLKEDKEIQAKAKKITDKVREQIDQQVVIVLDKLEEDLIRKMEHEYLATEELPLIYEVKVKTKQGEVTRRQLTFAGYIMAARIQGDIEVEEPTFKEVAGRLVATAFAVDKKRNIRMPGQSSRALSKDYEIEVLSAKAIRNALKRVLDPNIVEQVIQYARERKAIKVVDLREFATP